MSAEGCLYAFPEPFRLFCHHPVGFFIAVSYRVVASCPWVVQGGLVGTEVHMDVFLCKPLPEIDHIALICYRHDFLVCYRLADTRYEFVEVLVDLIHPSLVMSLVRCMRVYLRAYAYYSRYHSGLRLRTRHSSESGCNEEHALHVLLSAFDSSGLQLLACRVHDCYRSSVHDALRTDVHI